MNADPDAILLRRYTVESDETAFAELVRRHLGLVYHAALRQTAGDAHAAEDVTQTVFTLVAQKARTLAHHQTLTGWLHTTTRFAARRHQRTEGRRLRREQEAHLMQENAATDHASADWEHFRPLIDDVLADLNAADRDAVLLRFFSGLSLAEVGAKLDVSENAARMRVERALDKLHGLLTRRGIASSATALGATLAHQATAAAPTGLLASVTAAALSGAAGAAGGAAFLGGLFAMKTSTVLLLALAGSLPAADLAPSGPPQGTLIIVGGGPERGAGILETFINRAGGPTANFVIVPTAHGTHTADGQPKIHSEDEVLAVWRTRGLQHVRLLHTADPAVANSEEFVQPLRTANAIWFDGDQPQALLAAYANTLTAREFAQVLQRGGVIAGNAAGATAMGAYLFRTDLSDSSHAASPSPTSAKLAPAHAGFGWMRDTVFDLQINTRHRWDDLCPLIKAHPGLLGIGLSETTAIVVTGDRFEVIGKWTVTVHDSTMHPRPNEKPFRVLSPGDVFNLQTRRIEKLGNGTLAAPPLTPASTSTPTPAPSPSPTAATPAPPALAPAPLEYGPAKGTLIIAGGGSPRGTGIMETFVHHAGGLDAKIVIIPTAGGNRTADGQPIVYNEEKVLAPWKNQLGLKHVRMLHTPDPSVANTEEFVQPLREATGVWFDGGRQWHLVDSYANTLALREIHAVLARGGAVGGTSAGATIQGDYLVRGAIAGPDIVMPPEPEHQHGFAFLRHTAIDQHINTRNRWDDLVPVIQKYPEYVGLGLSESTAIIVTGDRFEVMGKWKVTVHDSTAKRAPWEKPYLTLSAGDVFNLRTRRIEKVGDQPLPIPPLTGTR